MTTSTSREGGTPAPDGAPGESDGPSAGGGPASDASGPDTLSDRDAGSTAGGRTGRKTGPASRPPKDSLPEAVRVFLLELASALQKHGMYPPGHPALEDSAAGLVENLEEALGGDPALAVRSRKGRLLVGDAASDPDQPLLSGLAGRLHGHQLLGVTFRAGLDADELTAFLDRLSEPADREGAPLGRSSADEREAWSHLDLEPLRYDPLETGSREADLDADDAWLEEARGEYASEIGGSDLLDAAPEAMARALDERIGGEEPDERMAAAKLFRLARQLADAEGRAARRLRKQMSRLIRCLRPETLDRLLELGREGGREESFLIDAADSLEASAVVDLIGAAAAGDDGSAQPLLRMLNKLSMYAEEDSPLDDAEERGVMGDVVRNLLEDWSLEDPNPEGYDAFLDHVSRRPSEADEEPPDADPPVEPERILKMALELDEWSMSTRDAADTMIAGDRLDELIDLLERAEEGDVRRRLWRRIARPEVVEHLLGRERPPWALVDQIVDRAGTAVAEPLLDGLARAEERSHRRRIFGLIASMGPEVGGALVGRLEDDRWFVRRNMLALLGELGSWPESFSPRPHLEDEEPRVRIEAFKLALDRAEHRRAALRAGLEDPDERVLRLALAVAEEGVPAELEPPLVGHAADRSLPDPLRVSAIRALGRRGSERARDSLLELVWVRRWFFWRALAPSTPPVRAAVDELARGWPEHPGVREAVEKAAASDDPRLRQAAGRNGSGATAVDGEAS